MKTGYLGVLLGLSVAVMAGAQPGPFLTDPSPSDALDVVLDYVGANSVSATGLQPDAQALVVRDRYVSKHNQATHLVLGQEVNGIRVHNGDIIANVTADGRLVNLHSGFSGNLSAAPPAIFPPIKPVFAIVEAASAVGVTLQDSDISKPGPVVSDALGSSLLDASGQMKRISYRLEYFRLTKGTLRLAWVVVLDKVVGDFYGECLVDAENGKVLATYNWVSHVDDYNVYPVPVESPIHGSRSLISAPADPTASPFGWHDTDGVAGAEFTDTRGNNVFAQEDVADLNDGSGHRPDGGASLVFNFPINLSNGPSAYQDAAIVNLFYWNNLLHDIHYHYGFDEVSGNFQENNYGKGGEEGDPVQADAQDGSGINNANFRTPPDGFDGRMQMYIFNLTDPNRDGDLDNGIIVHEFGHGVSTRLTGGPANSSCLRGIQSGGMGEGWSDWWGLVLTAKASHSNTTARGIGNYVLGQEITGDGIRNFPYTTDMGVNPLTYSYLDNGFSEVHDGGEIWCVALWDMYWNLVDAYGFSTNFYGGTNGNHVAMQLVMDGLKLQPCEPTFLDARDAILLADQVNNAGENQSLIWQAFAKRGMGFSAEDGGNHNSTAVTEAFDIPADMLVTPTGRSNAGGDPGGPFSPSSIPFTVANNGTNSLDWTASVSDAWLELSATNGTLAASANTIVTATVTVAADALAEDRYTNTIDFVNVTTGDGNTTREVVLTVAKNYTMQAHPFNWVNPASHQLLNLADDGVSAVKFLSFSNRFYGVNHPYLYISANGMVGFAQEGLNAFSNTDIPSESNPNGVLYVYWDDLNPGGGGQVRFGTDGVAPSRRAIITWVNIPHIDDSATRITCQAIIEEVTNGNNNIIFQYLDVSPAEAFGAGQSATIGLEDDTGGISRKYTYDGAPNVLVNGQAILFAVDPPPDTNAPTCEIRHIDSSGSESNMTFEVLFNEPVTGFDLSDINFVTTVPGPPTLGDFVSEGVRYQFRANGIAGFGSLTFDISASACVDLAGNPNEACGPVSFAVPVIEQNFCQDLEASNGLFTHSGLRDQWAWGVPTATNGPATVFTGTKCWGTNLGGNYTNLVNASLVSATIHTRLSPVLEFAAWYRLEVGFDDVVVEVNNGQGWVNVTPTPFNGISSGWESIAIPLSQSAFGNRPINVRFRLTSDEGRTDAGFYLDDFCVSSLEPPGLEVVNMPVTGTVEPGNTIFLGFDLYNTTTQSFSSADATVSILDPGVDVDPSMNSVSYGPIGPGEVVSQLDVVKVALANDGSIQDPFADVIHQTVADGLYPYEDVVVLEIDAVMSVLSNLFTAISTTGVTNWLGLPLDGDGGPESSIFTVMYAGPNGVIDPPNPDGTPGGDDYILARADNFSNLGRFGVGYSANPDAGLFNDDFLHALSVGDLIYVRAWDDSSFGSSVAYGDSVLFALVGSGTETKDFGSWGVGVPVSFTKDSNGDSVPDYWYILHGLDPRMPIEALENTLTYKSSFGSLGSGTGKFFNPSRVFLTEKFIFVLDSGNSRVQVWDINTSTHVLNVGSSGSSTGKFSVPYGLAVDPRPGTNRFVVADTSNHRVQIFDFDPMSGVSSFVQAFGSFGSSTGQFFNPFGVAVDTNGMIYVADKDNHRVQAFSPDGTFIWTSGSVGSGNGQFNTPRGMSMNRDGQVIVADANNHRLQTLDPSTGAYISKTGTSGTGPGAYTSPYGIQVGNFVGRQYVADTGNSRIQILTSNNIPVLAYGTVGSALGELRLPHGLMPHPASNAVFVADTLNHRIQCYLTTTDLDMDGMEDTWEELNGLDSTDPMDAYGDDDNDLVLNIGEYRANLNPQNPDTDGDDASDGDELKNVTDPSDPEFGVFRVTKFVPGGSLIFRWMAESGNVYKVQGNLDLVNTNGWSDLSGTTVTAAQNGVLEFVIPDPIPDAQRSYRAIRVDP